MAYDENLAARMRVALGGQAAVTEKPMMGGLCFFLGGNMIGGVDQTKTGAGRFMFRVGKDNEGEALTRSGASIVDLNGRRMGGMIFVEEEACDGAALQGWLSLTLSFVGGLPPK